MKLLLIDVNSNNGSTGKIIYSIYRQIKEMKNEVLIAYGRGKIINENGIIRIAPVIEVYFHALIARILGINGYFSPIATYRVLKLIKKFNPDIVHLNDLHGYYININNIIKYLKMANIKVVWTFHCEYMYTGKCGHSFECEKWKTSCGRCPYLGHYPKSIILDFTRSMQKWKKRAFKDWQNVTIVTPSKWLEARVRQSFLYDKNIRTIHNGIDTAVFHYTNYDELYANHKINGKKVILTVASNMMDENKGSEQFIELAKSMKDLNAVFIMIGVKKDIANLPDNIIPIKPISHQKLLAQYYSMADIFVICSKRETFPTVCLEALSCGTPICGYDVGGVAETAPYPLGKFVQYGDLLSLRNIIINTLKEENLSKKCEKLAKMEYSEETMFNRYYQLYQEIL